MALLSHFSKTATIIREINWTLFIGFCVHPMFSHSPSRSWLTADARWLRENAFLLTEGKLLESTNSLDPGGETSSTGAGDT